jgi:Flp pilus assembly protein TadG
MCGKSNRIGRHPRAGLSLLWTIVTMLVFTAIVSLAVDFGRVVIVKTQLRAAADAAALAAGQHVLSSTTLARAAAIDVAQLNKADGKDVILNTTDIEFVKWDPATRTYEVVSPTSSIRPNAVKVTAHRTSARGTAVDLPFAGLFGTTTCDVKAEAIAMATPARYAAVGLDFITMGGNSTNAYRANAYQVPGLNDFTAQGSIASNGDITLTGSSMVNGDAWPGVGKRVIGANHVTGSTNPLSTPLNFPAEDPGAAATINNNGNFPGYAISDGSISLGNQKSASVPGGVYYFKDLNMNAGAKLEFTGPATLYLTGNLKLGGNAITNKNLPKNLRIVMLKPNSKAELSGGSDLFADIYAPLAAITISGNGDIYGSIVGKSLAMSGEAAIHYDMSLTGGVSLVK